MAWNPSQYASYLKRDLRSVIPLQQIVFLVHKDKTRWGGSWVFYNKEWHFLHLFNQQLTHIFFIGFIRYLYIYFENTPPLTLICFFWIGGFLVRLTVYFEGILEGSHSSFSDYLRIRKKNDRRSDQSSVVFRTDQLTDYENVNKNGKEGECKELLMAQSRRSIYVWKTLVVRRHAMRQSVFFLIDITIGNNCIVGQYLNW